MREGRETQRQRSRNESKLRQKERWLDSKMWEDQHTEKETERRGNDRGGQETEMVREQV